MYAWKERGAMIFFSYGWNSHSFWLWKAELLQMKNRHFPKWGQLRKQPFGHEKTLQLHSWCVIKTGHGYERGEKMCKSQAWTKRYFLKLGPFFQGNRNQHQREQHDRTIFSKAHVVRVRKQELTMWLWFQSLDTCGHKTFLIFVGFFGIKTMNWCGTNEKLF